MGRTSSERKCGCGQTVIQGHQCSRCRNGGGGGGSIVLWGNAALSAFETVEYLDPGYSATQPSLPPLVPQYRCPARGSFRNLFMRQIPGSPPGNAIDITYQLRVNNNPTVLTLVLSSTASDGSVTANVSVEEGDLLDLQVIHDVFGVQAPQLVVASLAFRSS